MSAADGFLEEAGRLLDGGVPWAEVPGDAFAFVLAAVQAQGRCLVVVDEPDAAERLARGLRFFLDEPGRAEVFPADDVRPYDGFSPSGDIASRRTRVLYRWERGDPLVVIAPARALMQRIPDGATRHRGTREIRVGDTLDRDDLVEELTATGYLAAAHAGKPGSFSVRGDVVDVWSAGTNAPRRVDFFDDEVEEIRTLDPRNLRPLKRAKRLLVLPAREERLDDEAIRRLQTEVAPEARSRGREAARARRRLVEELRAGIRFSAIEDYLPALVPTETPLQAFGPARTYVLHPESVRASARDHHDDVQRRWKDLDADERPLVRPDQRWIDADALLAALEHGHPVYELAGTEKAKGLGARPVDRMAVRGTEMAPIANALRKLAAKDVRVGLVAPTARRAEMLEDLLEPHQVQLKGRASPYELERGELSLLVGDLPRGFIAENSGWAFIPATALFGSSQTSASRRAHDLFEASLTAVTDLKEGDFVVHRLHGIGRYEGLVRLDVNGAQQDFVKLAYRNDDLLYVPVTSLDQLSTYTPARSGATVRLDRLGGQTWTTRKGKVRDSLLAMAQDLLETQAKRELASREPHDAPGSLYKQFVARFPHTETPDQAQAILDVHDDLDADAPMDRLLCGDVGFGKTEVAMRAAMRVVEGGKQVAILCPTTVLAFQHHIKLKERFEGFPVNVAMLSRFSTPAEDKRVVAGLRDGSIDVVVGTHALLSRRVGFERLGLVVVDEEHRFGVKQKQRFKQMRSELDMLSMSATPIPRTMQMALSGARQMSVMATPPNDRLAVRTTIARFTRARVRDAIRSEQNRGGQVFFVHNRIESIEVVTEKLREWVPEARFEVAHGKMDSERIEKLLLGFMRKEFDVLVSTAIIESGVDLPNVNTMIVDRADLFGLAQLYQLRGRVGRSSIRGNCILLTPEDTTRDARKRLQVLVENTRLGSGFSVAAADLELRGGGNFLGQAQSGNIDAVGYQVWVELLEQAVHAARGDVDRDRLEPEVEVPVPAFVPENVVPDMTERLGWYRRLSGARTADELDPILDDFEHERGELPPEVRNLAGKRATMLLCRDLGIARAAWLKIRTVLEVHPTSRLTPAALEAVRAEHPKRIALEEGVPGEPTRLIVRFTPKEAERPFVFLRWILARLQRAAADHPAGPRR